MSTMIEVDEMNPVAKNFRAESAKLSELERDYGAIGKQIEGKFGVLAKLSQKQGQDAVTVAAQAMLAGGDALEVDRANIEKDLHGLERQQEILQKAIELQRRILDRARSAYSFNLNGRAEPEHEAIVLRMGRAFRELSLCFESEAELFAQLQALDASIHLRPMRRPSISAMTSMFLEELREFFPAAFKELEGLTTNANGVIIFKGEK
jgi:hypothetical protein